MRISVLTPTIKGREDLLRRCTYSVRWQTWMGSMEHVVVDNTGRSPAQGFQTCLHRALGTLIVPLADDDWLAPHALQTLHDLLEQEQADFASALTLISGSNQIVGHALDEKRFHTVGFDIGGAHMWRKTLTDRYGGFNPTYPNSADYDLYWRLAERTQGVFANDILYFYTNHPETDGNTTNGDVLADQYQQIRQAHGAKP